MPVSRKSLCNIAQKERPRDGLVPCPVQKIRTGAGGESKTASRATRRKAYAGRVSRNLRAAPVDGIRE
jgi:hypothetical protein